MKKLLVMLLVLAGLLTGCSKADETPEATPAPEAVTTETETTEAVVAEPVTVRPLPEAIMDNLDDSTNAVALDQGNAYVDDEGVMQMRLVFFTYNKFDMVDIAMLKVGDVLEMGSEEIVVTSVERDEKGTVLINGGLDNGGISLITDDNTLFYEKGYTDSKNWLAVGEQVFRVSPDFVFIDNFNPEQGSVTYYPGDFLQQEYPFTYHFKPENTTVRIEDGVVVEMVRNFVS